MECLVLKLTFPKDMTRLAVSNDVPHSVVGDSGEGDDKR